MTLQVFAIKTLTFYRNLMHSVGEHTNTKVTADSHALPTSALAVAPSVTYSPYTKQTHEIYIYNW